MALKGIVDITGNFNLKTFKITCSKGKIDVKNLYLNTVKNPSNYDDGRQKSPDEAVGILIASGPYTQMNSIRYHNKVLEINFILWYKPFEDLINKCKELMPAYLILVGPFLDEKNEILQKGEIEIKGQSHDYEVNFIISHP